MKSKQANTYKNYTIPCMGQGISLKMSVFVNPTHANGQLISEGYFSVFKSPKERTKLFEGFLPQLLKMDQIIKN